MKIRTSLKALMVLAGVLFLLMYPVSSKADTITYNLTTFNLEMGGGNYMGPYVSVEVNRTSSTTAAITFTSLTNGGYIYLMGDGSSAGVNVNATSFTITGISGTTVGTGFVAPSLTNPLGIQNVDSYGSFNGIIDNDDGFKKAVGAITFTLTDTSGTWVSADDVLINNTDGHMIVAHIMPTTPPANQTNGAPATGYADTPVTTVPEPGILILLGIAMSAIGIGSWRISKI